MREIIIDSLNRKSYLENVEKVESAKYNLEFILRNRDRIPLELHINEARFPFELPEIYIDKKKQSFIPNVPHITTSGYICYLDKEGVAWSDDIDKVFDFIFERIDYIFSSKESIEGIHREFQYYLDQVENIDYAFSSFKVGDNARKIKLLKSNKSGVSIFLDSIDDKNDSDTLQESKEVQVNNCIYIPFEKKIDIYVPNKSGFWSGIEIKNLINRCVSKENIKKIRTLNKSRVHNYYILDIVLATNEHVFVGVKYTQKNNENVKKKGYVPILDYNSEDDIKPILVIRIDDQNTLARGGAIQTGKDYNILVAGCGSVGSDLVFQLARSGFKNFTLIDKDKLNEENIYRHFLGKNRKQKDNWKTSLIKKELNNRYDEMNIINYNKDIFDLLENNNICLEEYSLIISAMGDINKERLLNKYVIKFNIPIIYTWVEAYGLAGHAVLTNNGETGCYNCLINDNLRNIVNFAGESTKPFVKNSGGCLGTFTPYGGMDSMQTAIIASRLAYDCLIRDIKGNKVLSWKGDGELFRKDGYKVDEQYNNFNKGIGCREDINFKGCKYCDKRN